MTIAGRVFWTQQLRISPRGIIIFNGIARTWLDAILGVSVRIQACINIIGVIRRRWQKIVVVVVGFIKIIQKIFCITNLERR